MNFKAGDVCEIIRSITHPELLGVECEVTGFGEGKKSVRIHIHGLKGNGSWRIEPHCLRLKRPPSKDDFTAGDWELMPWSPYKTKETTHG